MAYAHDDEPIPHIGSCWIATDGTSRPRAVLRCTDVRIGPLSSVDDSFAWDEGAGWLEAQTNFLNRYLPTIGEEFELDIEVVFERFTVEYQELPTTHSSIARLKPQGADRPDRPDRHDRHDRRPPRPPRPPRSGIAVPTATPATKRIDRPGRNAETGRR